jgi:hypothetical protein
MVEDNAVDTTSAGKRKKESKKLHANHALYGREGHTVDISEEHPGGCHTRCQGHRRQERWESHPYVYAK